jgi:hypothetical protein
MPKTIKCNKEKVRTAIADKSFGYFFASKND